MRTLIAYYSCISISIFLISYFYVSSCFVQGCGCQLYVNKGFLLLLLLLSFTLIIICHYLVNKAVCVLILTYWKSRSSGSFRLGVGQFSAATPAISVATNELLHPAL